MSTDADITKFAQHHVWENDGGSEMNLFGHEITIFMKILPYLSIAVRVPDEDGGTQTLIVGPDGFVAQEMVRKMRARSIFMCDQLLESPQYNVWYRHNAFLRRGETVIHSFPNILTENVMTSNRYSELGEFELYMTAMFLREPDMELADVDHTYPHGHSCMRVLVPRSQLKFSMLSRMVGHRSVRAVVMLALGFAVARPALLLERRPVWWLVEMLQALGVFLAQVDVKRRVMRWPETVWVLAVLPFSVIGVALFAASFYTILIAQDVRVDIDTVGQLLAANLTVFAPYYIDNGTWERAMVPLLQFTSIGRIDEMIMLAMNTSVAFALEESRADYFVQMHRHQMSGQELKFHLMREPLCRWWCKTKYLCEDSNSYPTYMLSESATNSSIWRYCFFSLRPVHVPAAVQFAAAVERQPGGDDDQRVGPVRHLQALDHGLCARHVRAPAVE